MTFSLCDVLIAVFCSGPNVIVLLLFRFVDLSFVVSNPNCIPPFRFVICCFRSVTLLCEIVLTILICQFVIDVFKLRNCANIVFTPQVKLTAVLLLSV